MQFIEGSSRHQSYFSTLEDQVRADNPVRLMDAFIDKLDLGKLGFRKTIHKNEGRPPYAPGVLLKLYLYGYLNKRELYNLHLYRCQILFVHSCKWKMKLFLSAPNSSKLAVSKYYPFAFGNYAE